MFYYIDLFLCYSSNSSLQRYYFFLIFANFANTFFVFLTFKPQGPPTAIFGIFAAMRNNPVIIQLSLYGLVYYASYRARSDTRDDRLIRSRPRRPE